MNNFQSIYLFLLLIFLSNSLIAQDRHLEKAESYYEDRFEEIVDGQAKSDNIDEAIKHYNKSKQEPEKYIGLLKSYVFKGSFTPVTKQEQKEYYEKGINLGEEKIKEYSTSPGITYWYLANLGRWGDLVDIITAANEGILGETRDLCNKVIDLDPSYHQAGALRLLGAIHLKAPNIPLVLTWPSTEKAKELLRRAYEIAPQNAANTFFYGKVLIETGNESSGKEILIDLVKRDPRPEFLLPDIKHINKGKELLENTF